MSIKHKFWGTWTKLDQVFRAEFQKNLENERGLMRIGSAEGLMKQGTWAEL